MPRLLYEDANFGVRFGVRSSNRPTRLGTVPARLFGAPLAASTVAEVVSASPGVSGRATGRLSAPSVSGLALTIATGSRTACSALLARVTAFADRYRNNANP